MRREGLAKNQHYVPRFILKNFTERKEQIWVFDKKKNTQFKTNIKNIAAENGFYDFTFQNNEVTFEPSLGKIEGNVSSILKKIIKTNSINSITNDERIILSNFFALQFVRTPQFRNTFENMGEKLIQSIRDRGFNPEDIDGFEEPTKEKTKLEHMRHIYNHGEFAPHFYSKTWVLLQTTEKHPYWISDNPITLQNMNDFRPYGNIGLSVKGIEIYFPISKTLCIGIWCSSHEEQINDLYKKISLLKSTEPWVVPTIVSNPAYIESLKAGIETGCPIPSLVENVKNHNSLQVKYSSRFVFSSNNEFSLLKEMLETYPHMKVGPQVEVS